MRSPLTSMILARLCSVSVTIPACEPGERHRGHAEVLDRHGHERHRDALAGGEQHVELAAVGVLGDVVREAQRGRRWTCPSPTRRPRRRRRRGGCARRDRPRLGCDQGRPPRCRRISGREARQSRLPARPVPPRRIPARYILRLCPAPTNEPVKKENARSGARTARGRARSASKRNRSTITFGIVAALFVGLIVILSVTGGGKKKADDDDDHHDHHADRPAGRMRRRRPPKADQDLQVAPPMTIDPPRPTSHTSRRPAATSTSRSTPRTRRRRRTASCSSPTSTSTTASRCHRIVKDFVIQGGDPKGDGTGGPRLRASPTEAAEGRVQGRGSGRRRRPNDPNGTSGSQFFVVTRADRASARPPYQYADFGTVTKGIDVVRKIEALPTDSSNQDPTKKATIDKITITESPAAGATGTTVATSTTIAK